jgi:hypothetical protein
VRLLTITHTHTHAHTHTQHTPAVRTVELKLTYPQGAVTVVVVVVVAVLPGWATVLAPPFQRHGRCGRLETVGGWLGLWSLLRQSQIMEL